VQAEVDRFLRELAVADDCAANTIAAYRNDLQQLREYLTSTAEESSWADVTPDVVQTYVHYLWSRGYAASTVARKVSALRSFFRFLFDQSLVQSDPLATIAPPKVARPRPGSLSREDVARLLALASQDTTPSSLRDRALLEVLYTTGLKASEVVMLEVEDVSLASSTVRCLTRGGERLIPLPPRTREALEVYLVRGRLYYLQDHAEQALFLNYRGQRLTRQGLWLLVQRYATEAGLDHRVSPQTLRHSFAAQLVSEGVEIAEVQELLGHVSRHTTRVYAQSEEKPDASPE
jgi:integrase/recombinase XerD